MTIILLNAMYLLQEKDTPLVFKIVITLLIGLTALLFIVIVFRWLFNFFEMAQVEYFKKKQFFTHVYFKRHALDKKYQSILKKEFRFYQRLKPTQQKYFEHRIHYYITHWEFIGKNTSITNTMKVMIAATAAKLTFGFRDYKINSIEKVIIYPKIYFSTINNEWHKGEFNLQLKALVFSWEDFLKGYRVDDDNINLGVHECIHAMHFHFLKTRRQSTSAAIFLVSFYELTTMLEDNDALKQRIVTSGYFRDYAFQNQFEFISVLVEHFIETPEVFKSQFPIVYNKVKEMLNFNFSGY